MPNQKDLMLIVNYQKNSHRLPRTSFDKNSRSSGFMSGGAIKLDVVLKNCKNFTQTPATYSNEARQVLNKSGVTLTKDSGEVKTHSSL